MFSCEICEIFKNTYFEESLWTTAFELDFKVYLSSNTDIQIWSLYVFTLLLFFLSYETFYIIWWINNGSQLSFI